MVGTDASVVGSDPLLLFSASSLPSDSPNKPAGDGSAALFSSSELLLSPTSESDK